MHDSTPLNGSLWLQLKLTHDRIDALLERYFRPLGLSVVEVYILRSLYEMDGQTASELAHSVGRAPTSFTPNLNKLQAKGYIERHSVDTDKRVVAVRLTDKAFELRERLLRTLKELDEKCFQTLGASEFSGFLKAMSTLQNLNL
jgi:DNA-binding MarR family transcriptional regulator